MLCDLDGVVWRGEQFLAGAVDTIASLQRRRVSFWFITNNSNLPPKIYAERLATAGVENPQVLTSASAAATLVRPGDRCLIAGGLGVWRAVAEAGGIPISNEGPVEAKPPEVDSVIVGLHRNFDYARLHRASSAVRNGAALIGTNSDLTFPTPDGERPGGGALLRAIEAASGVTAVLAGKPHTPMANLIRDRIGESFDADRCVMIGDRLSTDGRFAERLACRFLWVSSGVAADEDEHPAIWRSSASLGTSLDDLLEIV